MNKKRLLTLMGGSKWTPEKLNPAIYFVADDVSGNDGDSIASITDKNGNTFSQATESARPTLKKGANGINGHNVLSFDGGDYLAAGNILSGVKGLVWTVHRLAATPSNYQTLFSAADESSITRKVEIGGFYTAAKPKLYVAENNSGIQDTIITNVDQTTNSVFCVWISTGTEYKIRQNGSPSTLSVEGGGNNGDWFGDVANKDNTVIGALKGSYVAAYFNGSIAEIGVIDGVDISDSDITKLESYLAKRYNLEYL